MCSIDPETDRGRAASQTVIFLSIEIGGLTGRVGELIFSAFNLILQTFCFASGCCNLSLHLLAAHIGRHCVKQETPRAIWGYVGIGKKRGGR